MKDIAVFVVGLSQLNEKGTLIAAPAYEEKAATPTEAQSSAIGKFANFFKVPIENISVNYVCGPYIKQ